MSNKLETTPYEWATIYNASYEISNATYYSSDVSTCTIESIGGQEENIIISNDSGTGYITMSSDVEPEENSIGECDSIW
jgi:hypothetical protein